VLADLLTVREVFGRIRGVRLAYVGDGRNNLARSLMIGAAKMGVDLRILAPPELSPAPELIKELMNEAAVGARILITREAREALEGCEAVCSERLGLDGRGASRGRAGGLAARLQGDAALDEPDRPPRHDLPALPAGAPRRFDRVCARPSRGVRGLERGVREPAEPRLRPGREPHAHRQGGDGADV
jgi:hypothetical protein